jgi:phage FluMu gp28-like protein
MSPVAKKSRLRKALKKGVAIAALAATVAVDSASAYFLPYQVARITDETRLVLVEKSIRIGMTYCMAYRAVRRRVLGMGDCLVTSVSLPAAKEFIEQCRKFCEIFKIVASSIESVSWGKELNEQGFCITFPNGTRIFAFSSNPKAIRSFGGEVMVDEIAYHQDAREMMKAAGGRAMWGYPVTVWSSHNGVESEWNRRLIEERAKGAKSKWKIVTITLPDAIDQGLLAKINQVSGQNKSREDFIAETTEMCGGEEGYAEECLCQPVRSGDPAIKWNYISDARKEYALLRYEFSGDDEARAQQISDALITELSGRDLNLGYDVARTGHLAVVAINQKLGKVSRCVGLVKMHKTKFGIQRGLIERIMTAIPSAIGGGDKTGIGMQVCEELTETFGEARFVGMNFGALKPELGTNLTKVFESAEQEIPAGMDNDDIAYDLSGIKRNPLPSGRIQFTETPNPIEKRSHCDIAWALAMANYAGREEATPGVYFG